jgi:D-alanine-D-alanine ligase
MKPIANGSSVGLRIIDREGDIDEAARAATQAPDKRFMAEPFVRGRELTVGVVDFSGRPEPLPASEIVLEKGHRFDYDGKYLGRGSTEITPAALSPTDAAACQAAAVRAHEALGCYGYSRTDMILCDDGRDPVFLETNTLPGLSRSSFIPQQLRAAGWTLDAFVDRQLELARLRRDLRGSGISQGGATGQP